MKSLSAELGAILVGLFIFNYAEGWGEDWKLYSSSDYGENYYDVESITHPSENIVRVWMKWVFTEKYLIDLVRQEGEEYNALESEIVLYEYHCAEKKIRSLSMVVYSKDGGVFLKEDHQGLNWDLIVPESNGEILYKAVCK